MGNTQVLLSSVKSSQWLLYSYRTRLASQGIFPNPKDMM